MPPLIRIAFVVFALAFLTMFVVTLTVSVFAAFPHFWMSGPSIKVFAGRCQADIYSFARIEVRWRCRAKLYSIRQVNFNPNLLQGIFRGVFHETKESIALRVMVQDQSSTISDRVVAFV